MMKLLERDRCLASLNEALEKSSIGNGQVVLISGETGIGKTSLIEYFSQSNNLAARFLRGTCDPLFTPHPLCPLHDIARQLPDSGLSDLLWGTDRLQVFYRFLEELQKSKIPTAVVFEDAHWADEASLDLMRFLGRRIQYSASMMIITYRDDELEADHKLRLVLGNLSGEWVRRIKLKPLSESAVEILAEQSERHIENLYEITGGNPFYVTEVLAGTHDGVPLSVREAVLARTLSLSAGAREFLELASVVPKERFERQFYERISNPTKEVLDACTSSGLVRIESDAIIFRHELARQAIAESLPPMRWLELNDLALQALLKLVEEGQRVSRAHILHHAHQTGNREVVLQYVSEAAQEASGLGAHRQAVLHYRSGLAYADYLPADGRVELLENLAYECYLTGQIKEAIQHRNAALGIRRASHQLDKVGMNLRWLSRLYWFLGQRSLAEQYAIEAVEILDSIPPGSELAMAYSNRAQLDMIAEDSDGAMYWGKKAIALAQELNCTETLVHALNNVGMAHWFHDNETAQINLLESLRLALEYNFEEHAVRAYTNLGSNAVTGCQYDLAKSYLDEGIEYAVNHDLDSWSFYIQGWRARLYFEQGQWDLATKEAMDVIKIYHGSTVIRLPALQVLARLRICRGDPRADELLAEVYEHAQHTDEVQWLAPIVSAKAEVAWLQEDMSCVVEDLVQMSQRKANPWTLGRLCLWLWRAGELSTCPEDIAIPFRLQINGDWRASAEEWQNIGCPYDQALALMDGDNDAQKTALAILEQLGAMPAASLLRKKMRVEGVTGIARGPRRDTQENPAGLTQRQVEVLQLLVKGLSDNEIAEQLFISPKTAGHHVSAILGKLDVRTRQEAAVLAVQRRWFASE